MPHSFNAIYRISFNNTQGLRIKLTFNHIDEEITMIDYKTPDVYTVEKSTLPPSIVAGASALPAFVGYTGKARDNRGNSLVNVPVRINSMREYENRFGLAEETRFNVEIDAATDAVTIKTNPGLSYLMYHSLQLYFANGGSACYIVSVGAYGSGSPKIAALKSGLDLLEKEDEPTLLLPCDAVNTSSYHAFVADLLAQCNRMRNRFALVDMDGSDVEAFRAGIGSNYLDYGAAYYPYLHTSFPYHYVDAGANAVQVTVHDSTAKAQAPKGGKDQAGQGGEAFDLAALNDPENTNYNVARYHAVRELLDRQRVTLPPSAAIAGMISSTDSEYGAWKAPANVSLNAVTAPVVKLDNDQQAALNVDAAAGKSINAIRAFNGKGTLVWGARTLAGNSNEWRYVPVRRLFLQMETDIKRSTSYAVFEPNTATTWTRLRTQVESYLTQLWQDGGLAGATAAEAFFVRAGLGETMDEQDILEGRLNITVGAAAVRPAEFVVFTFTHKLQEA